MFCLLEPVFLKRLKDINKDLSIINVWDKKHIDSWCDFEMSKKKVFQTNFDSHGIKMNFIMRLPLFPSIISKLQCPSYVIVISHNLQSGIEGYRRKEKISGIFHELRF